MYGEYGDSRARRVWRQQGEESMKTAGRGEGDYLEEVRHGYVKFNLIPNILVHGHRWKVFCISPPVFPVPKLRAKTVSIGFLCSSVAYYRISSILRRASESRGNPVSSIPIPSRFRRSALLRNAYYKAQLRNFFIFATPDLACLDASLNCKGTR